METSSGTLTPRYPFAVWGQNIYCRYSLGYLHSTDFGSTWQDITQNRSGVVVAQMETQGTRVFASGSGVWVSSDSAKTWASVGFEGMSVPILTRHDSLLFVVANGELVLQQRQQSHLGERHCQSHGGFRLRGWFLKA